MDKSHAVALLYAIAMVVTLFVTQSVGLTALVFVGGPLVCIAVLTVATWVARKLRI